MKKVLAIIIVLLSVWSLMADGYVNGKFKIVETEAKAVEFERYDNGLVSMDIPKGWRVTITPQTDYVHYSFIVENPLDDRYALLFCMKSEGFFSTEAERRWWASMWPNDPSVGLPAIDPQTTEGFFRAVMPRFRVIENLGTSPVLGGDVLRATVTAEVDGKTEMLEGLFTATPMIFSLYYVNMVNVYDIMMMTTPVGELVNWVDVLDHCMGSITFSEAFTRGFMSQENAIATSSEQISSIFDETSDIITSGWNARQSTYDIVSQKQSDATLGYERVYDTETGDIYRVYNGFVEDFSSDNYVSERYKPVTDDMYLLGIDGYIEK